MMDHPFELNESMTVAYIKEVLSSVGLKTYGTKRVMIDRYNLQMDIDRKKEIVKPSMPQLKGVFNHYNLSMQSLRTKNELLALLNQRVDWQYTEHTSNLHLQNAIVHNLKEDGDFGEKCFICEQCGKRYASLASLKRHSLSGYIDTAGELIIKRGATAEAKFVIGTFDPTFDKQIVQLVWIPWYAIEENGTEAVQNVSVGWTCKSNVTLYAAGIWSCVQSAMKNPNVYLTACGSARRAVQRLEWYMKPELARPFGIICSSIVVASKVKGVIRELIGAVYVFSASDEFEYLENCSEYIVKKVELQLGFLSDINLLQTAMSSH